MAHKADGGTDLGAPQATKDGALGPKRLKIKASARDRLDGLSGLRIHPDAINFTSSKTLAYGGKAEVVKATLKRGDGSDEQPVAVKKLRYSNDINKRTFSNEFVHEAEVMARLAHENIIRLIGFVEDLHNGKAWFILSWEANGNVSEFLATGEWEIPERISLIKDTFAGLEYLHMQQPPICHGDLKSLNILVSASYRAIITDFGSARILKETEDRKEDGDKASNVTGLSAIASASDERSNSTRITIVASSNQLTLTGPAWSLRWAAPEVALGKQQNLASDIWAAGWICWEIMTNKVPFPELDSEGVITLKVVQGEVPAAREDAQLSQIIRLCSLMTDCWAFDPQNRPNVSRCSREVNRMPSVSPSRAKTSDSNGPSAELLYQMGHIHHSQGSFKQAILLFQQALSAATLADEQHIISGALCGLGAAYSATSAYAEAEQYLTQLRDICTLNNNDWGQANAVRCLAKVYLRQAKLTQAEESYTLARGTYSRLGDDRGQADTLRGLGNLSIARYQYLEAEEFFNQARDIYTRLGDDRGQANALLRLGELCRDRSEYMKAEGCFNQALDIYSRIGDNTGRANVLDGLGRLYDVQGLNARVVPLLEEARSIYAQIGNSKAEKRCSHWLDLVSKQDRSSTTEPPSAPGPEDDSVPSPSH